MRTAIIRSVSGGMAAVVYNTGGCEASNPMPVLAQPLNQSLQPGDKVVVAPLNGKKDGIVLGKYWNEMNFLEKE